MSALLEVRDVHKAYGSHVALDGVSFTVERGEICGLLGPNGAGKTTMVSIVAGLRMPDRGAVYLDGLELAAAGRAARNAVGLAGQETAVYPTVTVRENLILFADLAGLRGSDRNSRIEEVAGVLELEHLMDRLVRHLSGGERRRLHTAMALVHRPPVVLLDEPTTGVDVTTRQRLLSAVRRLAEEDGSSVVYSTHYLPEIEQLDATVVVLDHGRVLARGAVSELIGRHGHGAVEITLSCEPPDIQGAEVEASAEGAMLRFRGDHPGALLTAAVARLGAHAEHVVSVDVLQPSLESVFLELTGRRFEADHGDGAMRESVVAAEAEDTHG